MTEQIIVLDFSERQIRDLDAMTTTGYRQLRDDATEEGRAAALAIVHRIDANRRAIMAGEPAPDAAPKPSTYRKTTGSDLKADLLELRQEILGDKHLAPREVEDLKLAVLLLIMHLNHRAARAEREDTP